MAYSFDGSGDDVRFSPGSFSGYTAGPFTAAVLIRRGATAAWHGALTIHDVGGGELGPVLMDAIEFSDTNTYEFWNARLGSDSIAGGVAASHTDTTNFYIIAVTWGGANTAPRFHWKQYQAGSWTHTSIADSTGGDCLAIDAADRIIVGTDPSGGDDLNGVVVWAGMSKSDDSDVSIQTLDTTNFATIQGYGFEWLVGFQASGSITDRTGNGGDEVSRAGTTLVADPSGWVWQAAQPQRFMWMP